MGLADPAPSASARESAMKLRLWSAESDSYLNLDALRFVAAAAVVIYHYGVLLAWTPAFRPLDLAFETLPVAVDLFFVISGMIMFEVYGRRLTDWNAYGGFLRKRFARLAPLHYATLLFFIVAVAAATHLGFSTGDAKTFEPRCIAPNVLFLQSFNNCLALTFNKPSWSISAEMAMYVALPAFLWIAARRPLAWGLVGAFLAIALIDDLRGVDGWPIQTYGFGVVRAIPSFLLGIVLARATGPLSRIPAPGVLMGLALAALALECTLGADHFVRIITVYALATFALAADRRRQATALMRGLAPMGRLTFSIYMLHHPLGWALISVVGVKILHLSGIELNLAVAATAIVVVPLVAILSLFLFEEPMRQTLSGRGKAAPRRAAVPAPAH
jgi:peptidoglycan/LPS O-acetylase OafA/YrhL